MWNINWKLMTCAISWSLSFVMKWMWIIVSWCETYVLVISFVGWEIFLFTFSHFPLRQGQSFSLFLQLTLSKGFETIFLNELTSIISSFIDYEHKAEIRNCKNEKKLIEWRNILAWTQINWDKSSIHTCEAFQFSQFIYFSSQINSFFVSVDCYLLSRDAKCNRYLKFVNFYCCSVGQLISVFVT